jgi:hypothetical protein
MRKIRDAPRRTQLVLAAVVAAIVFAGVYGFAASLGITSSGLGAGNAVVSACGTGITVSYTAAYASSIPGYYVTQVNLASIPAGCLSAAYRIQLTGSGGATVGAEMTGTLPSSGTTVSIATSGTPDASQVTGISAVVG